MRRDISPASFRSSHVRRRGTESSIDHFQRSPLSTLRMLCYGTLTVERSGTVSANTLLGESETLLICIRRNNGYTITHLQCSLFLLSPLGHIQATPRNAVQSTSMRRRYHRCGCIRFRRYSSLTFSTYSQGVSRIPLIKYLASVLIAPSTR